MLTENASIVSRADTALASGSFGDCRSLIIKIRAMYSAIQKFVEVSTGCDTTAVMSSLAAEVQIVTRLALNEAFSMLVEDPEAARDKIITLEEQFTSYVTKQRQNPVQVIFKVEPQVLGDWSSNVFCCAIANHLDDAIAKSSDAEKWVINIVEPTVYHRELIENAKADLKFLVPKITLMTLPLVRGIALFEGSKQSAYLQLMPLMFLANLDVLDDPLTTAYTILHESLHQKFMDLRLTFQLIRQDNNKVASEASMDVLIPWSESSWNASWGESSPRLFSFDRAIAAYHVYVHSTLLHAAALVHLPNTTTLHNIGDEEITRRLSISFMRASYLANSLISDVAIQNMGDDGVQFIMWLNDVLNQFREISLLDGTRLGKCDHIQTQ